MPWNQIGTSTYAFAVRKRHKAFAERTLITSLPIHGYLVALHLQPLTLYTLHAHKINMVSRLVKHIYYTLCSPCVTYDDRPMLKKTAATPEAAPGLTVLATPLPTKLLAGTPIAPVVMGMLSFCLLSTKAATNDPATVVLASPESAS